MSQFKNNNIVPSTCTTPAHSSFSLLSVLGRQKLTGGENYLDWMRNLRITLRYENREYVLDEPIPYIDDHSTPEEITDHDKHYDNAKKVSCIMISAMSPDLQKSFENTWAFEMNLQLAEMFQQKARHAIFEIVKSLTSCKLKEGGSVCAHFQKMKSYIDRLENLDVKFNKNLAIDIVLGSLPASYDSFITTYHMNSVKKTLMELYNLLQTAEAGMKKNKPTPESQVLAIEFGGKKRKRSQPKGKGKASAGTSNNGKKGKMDNSIPPNSDPKEAIFYYCKEKEHWKRSYPTYLKDLKDGKVKPSSHASGSKGKKET